MKKGGKAGLVLIGVGTQLTSMVVAGFLLGFGLDLWLDSQPILMLILGCMGFIGGLLKVHKLLSRLD